MVSSREQFRVFRAKALLPVGDIAKPGLHVVPWVALAIAGTHHGLVGAGHNLHSANGTLGAVARVPVTGAFLREERQRQIGIYTKL